MQARPDTGKSDTTSTSCTPCKQPRPYSGCYLVGFCIPKIRHLGTHDCVSLTDSIETYVLEVIKAFVAIVTAWLSCLYQVHSRSDTDSGEQDTKKIFNNLDFENNDFDFSIFSMPLCVLTNEVLSLDMVATIKTNVFLGLSFVLPSMAILGLHLLLQLLSVLRFLIPRPAHPVFPRYLMSETIVPVPATIEELSGSATDIVPSFIPSVTPSAALSDSPNDSMISASPFTSAVIPSDTESHSVADSLPTPIEIDVEVDINIGSHPQKNRKGCKYANSHNKSHNSSSASSDAATSTISEPGETMGVSVIGANSSALSFVLPTFSAIPSESFNPTSTASIMTISSTKSWAAFAQTGFSLQSPSFGNLGRMIRHKRRGALRL